MVGWLDSRLESDSTFLVDLHLCHVRLHHNALFPWVVLVPKRDNVTEIIDLDSKDRSLLMEEIVLASRVMQALFNPTKLNVAALGNIVPQLHIHVIARYANDSAWPGPVWNSGAQGEYGEMQKAKRVSDLQNTFSHQKAMLDS